MIKVEIKNQERLKAAIYLLFLELNKRDGKDFSAFELYKSIRDILGGYDSFHYNDAAMEQDVNNLIQMCLNPITKLGV